MKTSKRVTVLFACLSLGSGCYGTDMPPRTVSNPRPAYVCAHLSSSFRLVFQDTEAGCTFLELGEGGHERPGVEGSEGLVRRMGTWPALCADVGRVEVPLPMGVGPTSGWMTETLGEPGELWLNLSIDGRSEDGTAISLRIADFDLFAPEGEIDCL